MGVDALGRPFQERTSTLIINCHGCRYQSKHYVLKNMWVTLEVPHPETGREPRSVRAKITWIQRPRTVRELFQIGVELEIPGNVWGIAFPPEDWFPFPESLPTEMPAMEAATETGAEVDEWLLPSEAAGEGNVRVLPGPGSAEASFALARQMARLVVEAKQQVQNAVREATAKAVEAETKPLLTAIQNQFAEAAERSVQAAAGPYTEQVVRQAIARIDEARIAAAAALREEWSHEVERRVQEAGEQLAAHLTQTAEAHRTVFDRELETQLSRALANLKKLSGQIGEGVESAEASLKRFQKEVAESAEAASRRWQEMLESQAEEGRKRLEKLEKAARQLSDEITGATAGAQAGWRKQLDADLAAAGARWNEKIGPSLESAAGQAAERLAQHSQTTINKLEQELSDRVATLRQSFEQATAKAESTLRALRTALDKETARAKASLTETKQAAGRMEQYASRLDALSKATAEELQRRFEAMLAAESSELNRRAESAVAGMADRLQPMLEAAGQQSLTRLAGQLEQQLAPHLDRANELLQKLSAGEGLVEEALRTHQERLLRTSERAVQEAAARLQETVSGFEKDFQEAGHTATSKRLVELEAKATDTTHMTFEALFKASEWYEKKVQTHMQAAIDKGLEQASNNLREKAGEISGLFASELDHYSRSYVEHTQGQVDEAVKDVVERARGQLAQAAETTAAMFGDEAHQAAQREFERFTGSVGSTFEQSAAQLEAHAVQVRSKIEAEARQFLVEFHKGMTQEIQQGVAQARQALEAQVVPVKEAWRAEREAQERQLQGTLARLGEESIDAYKKRLENASNSWLVASAATLSQQSQGIIETLANSAEQRLRETCSQVFAGVGEVLRQRLVELSTSLTSSNTPPEKK